MTDKAFEDWWKLLKPAECDEVVSIRARHCWRANLIICKPVPTLAISSRLRERLDLFCIHSARR